MQPIAGTTNCSLFPNPCSLPFAQLHKSRIKSLHSRCAIARNHHKIKGQEIGPTVPYAKFSSPRQRKHRPRAIRKVAILSGRIENRIGDGIVIRPRGTRRQAVLGIMNAVSRSRIDSPVETGLASAGMGLKAANFLSASQRNGSIENTGKVDEQRNRSLNRTKNSPIRRPSPLKAAVDNIFRPASLIGLRNDAAAPDKIIGDRRGQLRKRAYRQMADGVGLRAPVNFDAADGNEAGRRGLLCGYESHSERSNHKSARNEHHGNSKPCGNMAQPGVNSAAACRF